MSAYEQLNGNVHYQIFCGIIIDPEHPLTNYKLIDDISLELSRKLKIQQQQEVLADIWKPYMKNLDAVFTDATCYESYMRYPADAKLLWESCEKSYMIMCKACKLAGENRYRTKYNDIASINLVYAKQRRHNLRPIYHQKDEHSDAHVFLGLLAYWIVNTIRYRLKQTGMTHYWTEIVSMMSTQKAVTTEATNALGEKVHMRICSEPTIAVKDIYERLKYKKMPFRKIKIEKSL